VPPWGVLCRLWQVRGLPLLASVLGGTAMTWILFALLVVAGFALLKVRRRRKSRQSRSSYYDSKAA
jgi:hypothetical protein